MVDFIATTQALFLNYFCLLSQFEVSTHTVQKNVAYLGLQGGDRCVRDEVSWNDGSL